MSGLGSVFRARRALSQAGAEIPFLDGVRALAALIVFVSHASYFGYLQIGWFDFKGVGKAGVYLFFFLSAFLLSRAVAGLGTSFLAPRRIGHYAFRRFMRIYPLYTLYLAGVLLTSLAFVALTGAERGIPFYLSAPDVLRHLALMEGFGVTWSIAVEFKYYLVLSIAALVLSELARRHVLLAVAALAAAVAAAMAAWPAEASVVNDTRLGPYLPIFLIGTGAGVLDRQLMERMSGAAARRLALGVGALAALALVIMIPSVFARVTGRAFELDVFHRAFLLHGLLWFGVFFGCRYGGAGARAAFETPVMRHLGQISFGIYLFHAVGLSIAKRFADGGVWVGLVVFACTVAAAHLSFVLIERPASRLRPPVFTRAPPSTDGARPRRRARAPS